MNDEKEKQRNETNNNIELSFSTTLSATPQKAKDQ